MFARSLGLVGIAMLTAAAYAFAETPGSPMLQGHDMHGKHGLMGEQAQSSSEPTLPGQDAFGTIQEIVQILEADPNTDWSKVNIAALREHLIDMNEVTRAQRPTRRPATTASKSRLPARVARPRRSSEWFRLMPMSSARWAGTPRPRICRMA